MKALIVIDVQNEFSPTGNRTVPGFKNLIDTIRRRVEEAREQAIPIAWIRHFNKPGKSLAFREGSWGAAFVEGMGPASMSNIEVEFTKTVLGAFTGTNLRTWLNTQNVDDVMLLGFYTHACVSTTAREAIMLDLKVSIDPYGTGACDIKHDLLGNRTADEVRRSALLQLSNIGVMIASEKEVKNNEVQVNQLSA